MHTHTNVVSSGSRNCTFTSSTTRCTTASYTILRLLGLWPRTNKCRSLQQMLAKNAYFVACSVERAKSHTFISSSLPSSSSCAASMSTPRRALTCVAAKQGLSALQPTAASVLAAKEADYAPGLARRPTSRAGLTALPTPSPAWWETVPTPPKDKSQ